MNRFFDVFGAPVNPKSSTGRKSTDEIMRNAINVQIDIQNGKILKNIKGVPLKSWFNEDRLLFMPKIGARYLWGKDSAVRYKKGQEMSMLQLLGEMHEKGELEPYLKRVKEKRGM